MPHLPTSVRRSRSALGAANARVTAGEFLDASGGIDELLLPGEKGMAGRTNTEADVLLGGACMIDRAASADDLAFHVFGVNIRFHGSRKAYLNLYAEQAPIDSRIV